MLREPKRPSLLNRRSGFSLAEILAVVGIIAVVGFLLFSVSGRMLNVGDRARCTANLRVLYVGLDAYTQDNEQWPQVPLIASTDEDARGEWWIKKLEPYDVPESAWKCPGLVRLGAVTKDGKPSKIHYDPTQFDSKPRTPYKWSNMPWVIERGNMHGNGALMIFPDGSVRSMDEVLGQQGR